jgi:hypothetical protein
MLRPDTDALIAFLNEVNTIDPDFMFALCNTRLPCNAGIANNKYIQVMENKDGIVCGLLGLLNGYCGVIENNANYNGWGPIMIIIDDNKITSFIRTENYAENTFITGN